MYVRDELGDFSECAYSLLLSISFLLTHREAVISEQLVTASLRFIPLANTTASRETLSVLVMCEGGGGESLYDIQLLREGRFGGELIFITFAPKKLKKRSIR